MTSLFPKPLAVTASAPEDPSPHGHCPLPPPPNPSSSGHLKILFGLRCRGCASPLDSGLPRSRGYIVLRGFSRGAHDSGQDGAHQALLLQGPSQVCQAAPLRKLPISSPPILRICKSTRATAEGAEVALFAGCGEGKPFGQPLTHLPSANKGTAGPPSPHLRPGAASSASTAAGTSSGSLPGSWPHGPGTGSLFARNAARPQSTWIAKRKCWCSS